MDWALHVAVGIAVIGSGVYGVHLIWKFFVSPVYNALLSLSVFIEAQPTLIGIAHEFQPNDGETLRDQVDSISMRLGNIESSVEKLVTCYGSWNGDERRSDG